jgi:Raf kinase inhibitor-like YbhB/YbcL family protein
MNRTRLALLVLLAASAPACALDARGVSDASLARAAEPGAATGGAGAQSPDGGAAGGSSGDRGGSGGTGGDRGTGGTGGAGGDRGTGGDRGGSGDTRARDAASLGGADAGPADLAPVSDPGEDAGPAPAADAAGGGEGVLLLESTGFLTRGAELIFPASASYPLDHSPPFSWSGAPAGTRSFALTFVDRNAGATKWVVWDIPASARALPGDLSKTEHPAELPEASQRGSLGRTGYSGPGVAGPPLHTYEFVLWALDVEKLPGTVGRSTVEIREKLLPAHRLAASAPFVAKGQLGGP